MSRDYPTNSDDVIDVRNVISRVEELRDERKPKITVGFNMPGFLPDSDPSEYFGWEDARDALVELLQEEVSATEDNLAASRVGNYELEEDIEVIEARLARIHEIIRLIKENEKDEDFGATFGKYHYFMTDTGVQAIDDDSDEEELKKLEEFLEQLEGYGGDHQWEGNSYPVTLVNDDYFTKFAEDEAEQLGLISDTASWPHNCIDWERAARELKQDYSSADFDGVTYWYRSY
jgi:hypothetical protein